MNRIPGLPDSRSVLLFAALAFVLAFAFQPGHASNKTCASADIEEPFALPDGSVHPAGKLTLCHSHEHSPVKTMHRVLVDRHPVGLFSSERQLVAAAAEPTPYYLIFERRAGSTLRLAGYGKPSGGKTEMHLLDRPARVDVRDSVGAARR
jgi:hypothetical protein